MESATTLVIKVKYGNILRRFNASVVDSELEFNMSGLLYKVFSLFNFSPETDLILTYVDEDGDVVNLVDDHDLLDVVKQELNPLRITVHDVAPGLDSKNVISHGSAFMHYSKEKLHGTICNKEKSEKIIASHEKEIKKPSGFSRFSGPVCGPILSYQNPISESPVRNISQKDSGKISHYGVRCDGCGVFPITGPRFKSKVKMDYDLCSVCFEQMGIDGEYSRMDRPAFANLCPYMGSNDTHGRNGIPPLPEIGKIFLSTSNVSFDCCVIKDVNIPNGTILAPSTRFTKIWRLRNCGTAVWPLGTKLVLEYGDIMNYASKVELAIPPAGLAVDQEVNVAVDFISPKRPGGYYSHWEMAKPCGQKFGPLISVHIQVHAFTQQSPHVGGGGRGGGDYGGGGSCYSCGEEGHFSRECPNHR